MNIGFDAKRAFLNKTGLGNYSRTLINALSENYPDNNYFLFTPKSSELFRPTASNIKIISPSSVSGKLFKAAWRTSWIKFDLKKNNIDVFHGLSHEIPVGLKQMNIKSVVTIHDLIHERFPSHYKATDRKIYTTKFRYACENANKIIAISEQTKKDVVEFYNINPEKIAVVYQSCHPNYTVELNAEIKKEIQSKFNLPEKYLLTVGSITERKNLLTICKALLKIPYENRLPLVVIGSGKNYKKIVVDFIQKNGLEKTVIFLNDKFSIDNDDMPGIYQNATILLYPSLFEGFGIPILEGLSSKIPVLTSNISSMPEAGGEAAFYCNPNDENDMANQINFILTNPNLVQQRIQIGLNHLENFDSKKSANQVMKIYESVYKG